jgi:hypothetical protein
LSLEADAVNPQRDTEYRLRLVEGEGESFERLIEPFQACFKIEVGADYFKWKYVDNPAGKVLAYEALAGDTVAAFFGVIPEEYIVDGTVRTIYQGVDAFTHPDHQRRGLFGKVVQATHRRVLAKTGRLEIFIFPGIQAYPGFVNKLGYRAVQEIRCLFTHSALFAARRGWSRIPKLDFEVIGRPDSDLRRFLSMSTGSRIRKHYTPAVFEWRVFKHPTQAYTVLAIRERESTIGYCVYRFDAPRTCCIEWLRFADEQLYEGYTPAVIRYLLRTTQKRYVYTWLPTRDIVRAGYEAAGMVCNPFSVGPFADRFQFIVYSDESVDNTWLSPASYDLHPLAHD